MFKSAFWSAGEARYDVTQLKRLYVGAVVDHNHVSVAKGPARWWHVAKISPVHGFGFGRASTPGVIRVTLEVLGGSVGIVLWEKGKGEKEVDTANLQAAPGPKTIQLITPDLQLAGALIFRNDGADGAPIDFLVHSIECVPIGLSDVVDDKQTLHAFYDLSIYPHTYDFAFFTMAAEIARLKAGLKTVHVHIVRPGSKEVDRLPEGFHSAIDNEAREWRIYNILIPILTFFPTVRGYSVLPDAATAYAMRQYLTNLYPRELVPAAGAPIHIPYREVNATLQLHPGALRPRADPEGLRYIEQWLAPRARGRKPIVITLRQYEFLPARNSNVEAWLTFAGELDKDEYFPIIVPDTATALNLPPKEYRDITVCPEAAVHLPLRMALYESAFMNMATTGGPPMLLVLSHRCPFLYFKHLVSGVRLCSAEHLTDVGFKVGYDLPYLRANQHYVWEDDDLPVIRREFAAMLRRIKATT